MIFCPIVILNRMEGDVQRHKCCTIKNKHCDVVLVIYEWHDFAKWQNKSYFSMLFQF